MTDDERATRLLRPLRQDPDGPPAVDVARAMAEGRHRRALRRWSGGAALIAVTAVTAGGGTLAASALRSETPEPVPAPTATASAAATVAAPAGPKGCEVALLPTGGATKALVTAGSPSGGYLVGRLYRASANTIIWKDGKIVDRPRVPGSDATFYDVNSSGTAVGSAFPASDRRQAYVYRNGKVSPLDGRDSVASAINDAGAAVGSIGESPESRPVRWSSPGARVAELPLPAGAIGGTAHGIAEDGTVIGVVTRSVRSEGDGYLWTPDGEGRMLAPPVVGGRKATFFSPDSISGGWVIGSAVFDTEQEREFVSMRYRIDTGTYEKLAITLRGFQLGAENGWVLGVDRAGPAIVAGGDVVALPLFTEKGDYETTAFSADGRVAGGYLVTTSGNAVGNLPLRWVCG